MMGLHRKAGFHLEEGPHCVWKVWKTIGTTVFFKYQLGGRVRSDLILGEGLRLGGEMWNLILRRCNGRLAVAINVGHMSISCKILFCSLLWISVFSSHCMYSMDARKCWRNKLAKLRRYIQFGKIHFEKIHFGKIHFGKIQFGKIQFGKNTIWKTTIWKSKSESCWSENIWSQQTLREGPDTPTECTSESISNDLTNGRF